MASSIGDRRGAANAQSVRVLAGRYRLGRLIGEGGMGAVYEAEHIGMGATVAVKLLSDSALVDDMALLRFRREARAMGAVRHDNVVSIMDADTDADGTPFLVMECLEGESLSSVLRRQRRLQPIQAASVVRQILAGLSAAHACGIIHRDLKPANVFVSRQGDGTKRIKILDFGVSKLGDGSETLNATADGVLIGTPNFMAPEQVEGRSDIDARADLYASGIILYRALTGLLPFVGESADKLYGQILRGDVVAPRKARPEISQKLDQVVLRAMRPDRDERFQTACEFTNALADAVPDASTDGVVLPTGTGTRRSDAEGLFDTHTTQPPTRAARPGSLAIWRGTAERRRQKRRRLVGWLAGLSVCAAVAVLAIVGGPAQESVRVGVVHYLPTELLLERHGPLIDYLEEALDRDVELVVAQDHDELTELLVQSRVHLAALSSYNYVQAVAEAPGIRVLATPVVPGGATSYEGLILTRADSKIDTVQDLRGKSFCFVDPGSSSGYLYPRAILIGAGLNPDHDFDRVLFGGNHLSTLRLLIRGQCDGAAVFASILYESGKHGIAPEAFRVLASTPRIPLDAYCVPPNTDKQAAESLKSALLALVPGSALASEIMLSSGSPYAGFAPIDDAAYDGVRRLERNLQSSP